MHYFFLSLKWCEQILVVDFSHLFIPSLLLFLTVFLVFRTQSIHERIVSLFYCNNNKSHSQCLVETNTGVFMGQWHFHKSTLVNPPRWSRQVWPIFQQMFESNITAVFKNCGQKYPTINSLFRKKSFLLYLKTKRNASKFDMFVEKENPRSFFHFSFRAFLSFTLWMPRSMST